MTISPYATSFPLAQPDDAHWTDRVVTQGHADYCRDNGHAKWVIDDVVQPHCPRCGDRITSAPTTNEPLHGEPIEELSDDQFKELYENCGDRPLHFFSDEDLAFRYAKVYKRCVYNDDTQDCIICFRADH